MTTPVPNSTGRGPAVLRNPQALALLGCLSLQRIAIAAVPVVLVIAAAAHRGYAAAAVIQAARVVAGTASAPFRARLLDRVGRHRVIAPQVFATSGLQFLLAAAVLSSHVPIGAVVVVAVASALTAPSMDAVIRTTWRSLGVDAQQVKALHTYDSILDPSESGTPSSASSSAPHCCSRSVRAARGPSVSSLYSPASPSPRCTSTPTS